MCFITDTGACSGNSFGGGANIEDGGHGTPGGSGGNSGTNDDGKTPDYNLDNDERCKKEGYNQTGACPAEQTPNKVCPYNSSYHDKCVCKSDLVTCTKPEYGVGTACGGKYLSCQRDDAKACKEDGYTQSAACSSTQQKDGLCPYNNAYYKQCVCRSDLVSCSSPKIGVGTPCDGKYTSCTCPSSYRTCSCGGYNACTINGTTKYSSCMSCSSDSDTSSDYERELWVNSANPEDGSYCAYSYRQKECEFNCRGTNYYLKYEKKVYGLSCNTFGDFDVYKCICN